MCLVNDQHGKGHLPVDPIHYFAHALIISNSGAAQLTPAQELVLQMGPVQEIDRKIAEFLDLTAPVDHDRGRAYHQKAGKLFLSVNVRHRRNSLNRLAKSHLISQQNSLHGQNILSPELLIGAKVALESPQVQCKRIDLFSQLRGDTAVQELLLCADACQALNDGIVRSAVLLKIRQRFVFVHRKSHPVLGDKTFDQVIPFTITIGQNFTHCPDCLSLGVSEGENPVKPTPDHHRLCQPHDVLVHVFCNRLSLSPNLLDFSEFRNPMDQLPALHVIPVHRQPDSGTCAEAYQKF